MASENMGKMSEEKILSKMEKALKNREEQLEALQERLQEHVSILQYVMILQSAYLQPSKFLLVSGLKFLIS